MTAISDFDGQPGSLGAAPEGCLAVADDEPRDFSNYAIVGSADQSHTVAAPGGCILSTWLGGSYTRLSGTSMASPHGAGAVALCIHSGHCTGTPAHNIHTIIVDAYARPANAGFTGDPDHPLTIDGQTHYYGPLLYVRGY